MKIDDNDSEVYTRVEGRSEKKDVATSELWRWGRRGV